jgi:putative membrane protein
MRLIPLIFALVTLGAAWLTPLPHAFFAHMTVHMSVVAVAAPLLAYTVAGGPWDPVRRRPVLWNPLLASLFELAVVWLWHTPALHQAARTSSTVYAIEQAAFLLSGLALWMSAIGGEPVSRTTRGAAGIAGLLLTAMHMTLLGAILALAPRPLYANVHGYSGMSPLEDQHLGGAIMLIVGGASYLAGGLWLSARMLGGGRDSSGESRDTPRARANPQAGEASPASASRA